MPEKNITDTGIVKETSANGVYAVQKSRSFGGLFQHHEPNDSPAGRRTPNLGSLRKKFALSKKAVSLDEREESEYSIENGYLKKKNKSKVGNILKWFRKDKDEHSNNYGSKPDVVKSSKISGHSPNFDRNVDSSLAHRSASYDSVCSIGSVASSFAFVSVNHYKVGKCIESNKKIPIALTCSPETYKARIEVNKNSANQDITLKTKYKLQPSESPPTLRRNNQKENFSAISGPLLPSGPILPSPSIHQRHINVSDDDSCSTNSDDTLTRLESVSQQGSPDNGTFRRIPDNENIDIVNRREHLLIKPRERSGQFLYPVTIKGNDKNALINIGTSLGPEPTEEILDRRKSVNEQSKIVSTQEQYPRSKNPFGFEVKSPVEHENPFGDTVSLAATLPKNQDVDLTNIPDFEQLYIAKSDKTLKAKSCPSPKKKGPAPQPPVANGKVEYTPPSPNRSRVKRSESTKTVKSNPASPLVQHKKSKSLSKETSETRRDSLILEQGILKFVSNQPDVIQEEIKEKKDEKPVAPLSPKPWYKRSNGKDTSENKHSKEKDKKGKIIDDLPDHYSGRASIKQKDKNEEKTSNIIASIIEFPKSPKSIRRKKSIPKSPKAERPNSRPISALIGISDLDRQAAEIITRRNEEEAAKRKAFDEKFYTNEQEIVQDALSNLMEDVSSKMRNFDNIEKKNNKLEKEMSKSLKKDINKSKEIDNPGNVKSLEKYRDFKMSKMTSNIQKTKEPDKMSKLKTLEKQLEQSKESECSQTKNGKDSDKSIDIIRKIIQTEKLTRQNSTETEEAETQNMDSVVSDLYSYLATTKKEMSSPLAQRRLCPQEKNCDNKELNVKVTNITPIQEQNEDISSSSTPSTPINAPLQFSDPSFIHTTPLPLSPLRVEKNDGWSCGRCTLINFKNQLWCEACGGQRIQNSMVNNINDGALGEIHLEQQDGAKKGLCWIDEKNFDPDSEEAPPKIGNVLDKVLAFHTMEVSKRNSIDLETSKNNNNIIKNEALYQSNKSNTIRKNKENKPAKSFDDILKEQEDLLKQAGKQKQESSNSEVGSMEPNFYSKDNTRKEIMKDDAIFEIAKMDGQIEGNSSKSSKMERSNDEILKEQEMILSRIAEKNQKPNTVVHSPENNQIPPNKIIQMPHGNFNYKRTPGSFLGNENGNHIPSQLKRNSMVLESVSNEDDSANKIEKSEVLLMQNLIKSVETHQKLLIDSSQDKRSDKPKSIKEPYYASPKSPPQPVPVVPGISMTTLPGVKIKQTNPLAKKIVPVPDFPIATHEPTPPPRPKSPDIREPVQSSQTVFNPQQKCSLGYAPGISMSTLPGVKISSALPATPAVDEKSIPPPRPVSPVINVISIPVKQKNSQKVKPPDPVKSSISMNINQVNKQQKNHATSLQPKHHDIVPQQHKPSLTSVHGFSMGTLPGVSMGPLPPKTMIQDNFKNIDNHEPVIGRLVLANHDSDDEAFQSDEENTYSAISRSDLKKFTKHYPVVKSLPSTSITDPIVQNNFGFVSSGPPKDKMPKPPRRRSKDSHSRSQSRQGTFDSREATPCDNFGVHATSPIRPKRIKNKPNSFSRPKSLQESQSRSMQDSCNEPRYEILNTNTFHIVPRRRHTSTDSEMTFRTPATSPTPDHSSLFRRTNRTPELPLNRINSVSSLQNTNMNSLPQKTYKTDKIPPRSSQEPIPTPRKSTLENRKNKNGQTAPSEMDSEPYYKVPNPVPIPVASKYSSFEVPDKTQPVSSLESHLYEEPVYKDESSNKNRALMSNDVQQEVEAKVQAHVQAQVQLKQNYNNYKTSGEKNIIKNTDAKYHNQFSNPTSVTLQSQNQIPINERIPNTLAWSIDPNLEGAITTTNNDTNKNKGTSKDYQQEFLQNIEDIEKGSKINIKEAPSETNLGAKTKDKNVIYGGVKKRQKEDTNEARRKVKSSKKDKSNYEAIKKETCHMKPDWLDDMHKKTKETNEKRKSRPISIIDGVLYTSKIVKDRKDDQTTLACYSLIEPEEFEMYDFCQEKPRVSKVVIKSPVTKPKLEKKISTESESKNINTDPVSHTFPQTPVPQLQTKPSSTNGDTNLGCDSKELKDQLATQIQQERDQRDKQLGREPRLQTITTAMFVEDAVSAQGPISVVVNPDITVAGLKLQIQNEFEIPSNVQKWILGKSLATVDCSTLRSQGVEKDGDTIFLYLVAPNKDDFDEDDEVEEKAAGVDDTALPSVPIYAGRKGKYWNYENERWSYCDSDSDSEEPKEGKKEGQDGEREGQDEGAAGHQRINSPGGGEHGGGGEGGDEWECSLCTLRNPMERPGCEACTTPRPEHITTRITHHQREAKKEDNLEAYKQLENLDLIPNTETFECLICYVDIDPGEGVVLRECLHSFCKLCLSAAIEHSDAPAVKCPYKDEDYSCDMDLLEREVKALVSSPVFKKHQLKSMKEAEANMQNAFHCRTPDCVGWTIMEDDINTFSCPACKQNNCITCQAIHEGMDCKQYQASLLQDDEDEDSKKTRIWLDGLIQSGEALQCPKCQVILLKKWGCDWVRCTFCRTEICWVTRQLRWGPKGKGDTSGGCKCLADGRTKCHKSCNYCH